MKDLFKRLTSDKALKVAQLILLAWLATEVHLLNGNVYRGPELFDPTGESLKNISEQLGQIARVLALKH